MQRNFAIVNCTIHNRRPLFDPDDALFFFAFSVLHFIYLLLECDRGSTNFVVSLLVVGWLSVEWDVGCAK